MSTRQTKAHSARARQERTVRLIRKPQPNQRIQRERRVADPRRAVVPVARPADVLGQAERRARDDRARRLEDEQLERERAPVHGLLPRAAVRRPPDPRRPVLVRLLMRGGGEGGVVGVSGRTGGGGRKRKRVDAPRAVREGATATRSQVSSAT